MVEATDVAESAGGVRICISGHGIPGRSLILRVLDPDMLHAGCALKCTGTFQIPRS